ncbi:MAG: hypothetical protein NPIRA02_06940 [Nitrospirales bacterium]|nr:MAG: hypothetical protein NPIRA02_06940 [Nitrospirales bacterium]
MSEHPTSNPTTDPVTDLLPWFVTERLNDSDRQAVEQHLPGCEHCQRELEYVRRLQHDLEESYATLPEPSPEVYARIQRGALQEETSFRPKPDPNDHQESRSWLSVAEERLRPLWNVRWVPALVGLLIVGQTTLLMWDRLILPQDDRKETPDIVTGPVTERSLKPGIPQVPSLLSTVEIQLAFQEGASEQDLRSVMHRLNGQIVDGPSPEGVYVVEVSTNDIRALDEQIQVLRSKSDLIRIAKRLYP